MNQKLLNENQYPLEKMSMKNLSLSMRSMPQGQTRLSIFALYNLQFGMSLSQKIQKGAKINQKICLIMKGSHARLQELELVGI